jgi:hypothetical protein
MSGKKTRQFGGGKVRSSVGRICDHGKLLGLHYRGSEKGNYDKGRCTQAPHAQVF